MRIRTKKLLAGILTAIVMLTNIPLITALGADVVGSSGSVSPYGSPNMKGGLYAITQTFRVGIVKETLNNNVELLSKKLSILHKNEQISL